MEYKEILSYFEGVSGRGYKRKALCPVHNDKEASLGITYKDSRTIINCLSHNCNINDIVSAVGLTIDDLKGVKATKNKSVGNGLNSLAEVEKHLLKDEYEGFKTTKVYKYYDSNNKLAYLKTRKEKTTAGKKEKKFQFFRYEKGCLINSLESGLYYEVFEGANIYSKKEKPGKTIEIAPQEKILYNLPNVISGVKLGETIFVVEGEKDVETLKNIGFIATTSPTGGGSGKDKWNDNYSKYLKGADVVVIADNDEPGQLFANQVKKSLLNYCYKVRVLTISDEAKGDITDWFEALKDKGQAYKMLIEQVSQVKPVCPYWYEVKEDWEGKGAEQKKVYKIRVNTRLLAVQLETALNVVYVSDNKVSEPLRHIYKGGVYEPIGTVKGLIQEYLHPNIKNSNNIAIEVEKIMRDASYNNIILPGDMVGSEHIINVGNGLLDTNTMELFPHNPGYKTIYQLKCNYDKKARNFGLWDNYINHLCNGDDEVYNVLQEFAGLVLSNYNGYRIKGSLALYGKPNSGKSVFLEALSGVVGAGASGVLSLQELGERFATTALYGKRLVYDADMSRTALSNVDAYKKITGGDKISVEFKGKDRMTYKYTGVYAFACNELPMLSAEKGEAVHNRINIIRCDNVVENKIVGLVDMIIDKESDYIFLWALKGLERLKNNNWTLSPCNNMEQVRNEYKALSDSLFEFVNVKYSITGSNKDRIPYNIFKDAYINYCDDEGRTPIKKRSEYQSRLKGIKGVDFGLYKGNYFVKGIVEKLEEVDTERCPF